MRMGTASQIPGEDLFPPIEFAAVVFVGGVILCTAEDPISPTVGWSLKPCQGPK